MSVQNNIADPQNQIANPSSVAVLASNSIKYLRTIQQQLNRLSAGGIAASTTAAASPPAANSTNIYAQGDFIRNSAPVVLGTSGSQYVVIGWVCVAGGKPGTWVQSRTLTGT